MTNRDNPKLTTPQGWGAGGRPATMRTSGGTRRERPTGSRRFVEARLTRAGDTFRAPKSGAIYSLLADPQPRPDGQLDLIVHTPSGDVRTWIRQPSFQMERA
jgi:hypothetical protein